MGSPIFDRQVFVKKRKEPQKSPSISPLPGGLVLILVAALSAFATYRYVKAGGTVTSNPADKAQIAELQAKLKAMQDRVNELEKRRHAAPARNVADKTGTNAPKAATASSTLLAESAPRSAVRMAGEPNHYSKPASGDSNHSSTNMASTAASLNAGPAAAKSTSAAPKTAAERSQPTSSKGVSALRGNLAASREEWEATTDRLGNVVGELDTQRSALQKTQSGVNYLLERTQSSDVPFTLSRGSGLQRVGPISMELESTSIKGQHYNIRMIVDDKSVELKNRALNEVVQFYTSRSKYPLRLIVSRIGRGQVSGTLAVPIGLSQGTDNTHLQER